MIEKISSIENQWKIISENLNNAKGILTQMVQERKAS